MRQTARHPGEPPALPRGFAYFDLGCAAGAGALWYLFPALGGWPLVLGLLPWVVRLLVTRRPTHLTGFEFPLLLFLATAALSIWTAYDRALAWSKFWLIVGAILLFYAFANGLIAAPPSLARERFVTYGSLLAIFGGVLTVYFLFTHDGRLRR